MLSLEEKKLIQKVIFDYPCNDAEELQKRSYETYQMKKVGAA